MTTTNEDDVPVIIHNGLYDIEGTVKVDKETIARYPDSSLAEAYRQSTAKVPPREIAAIHISIIDKLKFLPNVVKFMKKPSSVKLDKWSVEDIAQLWSDAKYLKVHELADLCKASRPGMKKSVELIEDNPAGGLKLMLHVGEPIKQSFEIKQHVREKHEQSLIAKGFKYLITQIPADKSNNSIVNFHLTQNPKHITEIVHFLNDPKTFEPKQWSLKGITRLSTQVKELRIFELAKICSRRIQELEFNEQMLKVECLPPETINIFKKLKDKSKYYLLFNALNEDLEPTYNMMLDYYMRFPPDTIQLVAFCAIPWMINKGEFSSPLCPPKFPLPEEACFLYSPEKKEFVGLMPDPNQTGEGVEHLHPMIRSGKGYQVRGPTKEKFLEFRPLRLRN